MKYNFVTHSSNTFGTSDIQKPNITSFYQICQYPVNGMILVRKLLVDDLGNTTQKIKKYKSKKINSFLINAPANKVTVYPTHTLDNVPFPSGGDILAAKSTMLNNTSEYSGFASFV